MGRWLDRLRAAEKGAVTLPLRTDETDKTLQREVLSVLSVPKVGENTNISLEGLPTLGAMEEWQAAYDERGGILEYDEGLPRVEAERLAGANLTTGSDRLLVPAKGRGVMVEGELNPMPLPAGAKTPVEAEPSQLAAAARCGARTRSGQPCRQPKVAGRPRCRLHGGASGSGAPAGARNGRFRDGHHTKEARAERRWVARLLRNLVKGQQG